MICRSGIIIVIISLIAASVGAQEKKATKREIDGLIDRLVDVANQDIDYSDSISGGERFAPIDFESEFHGGLLFQPPPVRSDNLIHLIKLGPQALPQLLAHLDDKRLTGLTMSGGVMRQDEPDRNPRVDRPFPPNLRQVPKKDGILGGDGTEHTITVGDLCYVAIGQIVNRHYVACRYQPTLFIIVSSPTSSANLCALVRDAWAKTQTAEQHRAALIADFLKPDSVERLVGATKRLAYYYPDALEPLILGRLKHSEVSDSAVLDFISRRLYRTKNEKEARERLEEFVKKNGNASREAVHHVLIDRLHASDRDAAEKELMRLFGHKAGGTFEQRVFCDTLLATEWIECGLVHDQSAKVDRAVCDLLGHAGDDHELAFACMQRLVGRGFDREIESYFRVQLPKEFSDWQQKKEKQKFLDKLGWTRLHVAVERDDVETVSRLIQQPALVNQAARNGDTPLHVACAKGQLEAARLMLAKSAALNSKNNDGLTPVQMAIREQQFAVVKLLADRGCDTPDFLSAVCMGQANRVKEFLRKDPKAIGTVLKDFDDVPVLRVAIALGHAAVVDELLSAGAKTEPAKKDEWSSLQFAVFRGHADVVRVLLKYKGNPRERREKDGAELLHLAAAFGHPNVATVLLDAGVNVDVKDELSEATPLHYAARFGQTPVVDLLLKRGAKVDAAEDSGWTAIFRAADQGHVATARRLLDAKATVNARDFKGNTPLHEAAGEGHTDMVKLLLEHGADRNAKNNEGGTARGRAEDEGHKAIIELLDKK